jgi:hypothetical protein
MVAQCIGTSFVTTQLMCLVAVFYEIQHASPRLLNDPRWRQPLDGDIHHLLELREEARGVRELGDLYRRRSFIRRLSADTSDLSAPIRVEPYSSTTLASTVGRNEDELPRRRSRSFFEEVDTDPSRLKGLPTHSSERLQVIHPPPKAANRALARTPSPAIAGERPGQSARNATTSSDDGSSDTTKPIALSSPPPSSPRFSIHTEYHRYSFPRSEIPANDRHLGERPVSPESRYSRWSGIPLPFRQDDYGLEVDVTGTRQADGEVHTIVKALRNDMAHDEGISDTTSDIVVLDQTTPVVPSSAVMDMSTTPATPAADMLQTPRVVQVIRRVNDDADSGSFM